MTKGTFTRRASVFASNVLPEPVGPINNTLLLSNSTKSLSKFPCSSTVLPDSPPAVWVEEASYILL
nr:Uncharacterised protein [Ipomoea batatas]